MPSLGWGFNGEGGTGEDGKPSAESIRPALTTMTTCRSNAVERTAEKCRTRASRLDFLLLRVCNSGLPPSGNPRNRMATFPQRDIKTLTPGSKNIQKCIQCVKAFSGQQKRALGSAISESSRRSKWAAAVVMECRGGGVGCEISQQNHISLSVCPPCVPSGINDVELHQSGHERAASRATTLQPLPASLIDPLRSPAPVCRASVRVLVREERIPCDLD